MANANIPLIKGHAIFTDAYLVYLKIHLPDDDSHPQKFLKTSKSFGDTGGAVFQSFSGYASKFEVSPSPHSFGTMGGCRTGVGGGKHRVKVKRKH